MIFVFHILSNEIIVLAGINKKDYVVWKLLFILDIQKYFKFSKMNNYLFQVETVTN